MELSYISVQLYTRADSGGEIAMLRGSTRGYNGEKHLPAQHKLQSVCPCDSKVATLAHVSAASAHSLARAINSPSPA